MASGKAARVQLSDDEVDDILYLTRTNESAELQQYLTQLSQQHNCSIAALLESTIDEDNANTPFHYCAANGYADLLKTLSSQLDPSTKTEVLSRKNEAGNTALHWASVNGHVEAVKALIEGGVDVWVKNAAGHLPVFEAERAEKDEVVATLLIAGGKEDEEKSRAQEGEATEEDKADVEGVTSQMGESSLEK
ncbi:ankyrin [Aureobasidium sp. EXF-3400]|nr:ankyrin [Aureobasidium sp. EXF-12344]KAI4779567.1 ankyrin [Aureobasidium sp. EXF-3400]